MSNTSTDRSISGLSLAQWMKTKIGDRYDLEQATFSPPHEDDSFFFIRYPPPFETEFDTKVDPSQQTSHSILSDSSAEAKMKRSSTEPDSQFKKAQAEENTAPSMISYAQNMITGKLFGGYLSSDKNTEDFAYKSRQRRNSKSLPTSPQSSPKIYRRNPYFTDPFIRPDETYQGSAWILSILSQRKSIDDLTIKSDSSASENNSPKVPRKPRFLHEPKPKPSELREMNFWSPVSM